MTFLTLAFAAPRPLALSRGANAPAPRVTPRRPRVATATISPPRPPSAPPVPAPSTRPPSGQKRRGPKGRVTVDGDTLETAPRHVALVSTHAGLAALLAAQTVSSGNAAAHALAIVGAYVLADLFVGIYHHALDNYGSSATPVFGFQIAAFQGHHTFPWTIAARSALNNLHRPAAVALPLQLALLFVAATPERTLIVAMITFAVLSQETHRQAHATRPAPWARALQCAGVIIRPTAHARHHRVPHASNYCIISGWCNGLLDGSGFFRAWEGVIYAATGVRPLDWKLEPALEETAMRMLPSPLRAAARRRVAAEERA